MTHTPCRPRTQNPTHARVNLHSSGIELDGALVLCVSPSNAFPIDWNQTEFIEVTPRNSSFGFTFPAPAADQLTQEIQHLDDWNAPPHPVFLCLILLLFIGTNG